MAEERRLRRAEWFTETEKGWKCTLCPRGCGFPGEGTVKGACRVRGVRDGIPYLPGYGECVSLSMDPMEKKPLYHFLPGEQILSTGPAGCNLTCDFCQNWAISQRDGVPTRFLEPEQLANAAISMGSCGVAFTYTEPTIWYEYIADTAPLIHAGGGVVVMVSNGEVNSRPLKEYLKFVDAWNVDLKAWSEDFYRKHCGGPMKTVLETLETIASSGGHLEITFLVIPGENDNPEEWMEMGKWIAGHCGENTVLHVSRYFPRYRLGKEPTPQDTLRKAYEVFRETLNFVYLGNVDSGGSDTVCPGCGSTCISRVGWLVDTTGLRNGRCAACGGDLNIVSR